MAVDVMAAKPNCHNIFVDCITTCMSHISCIYVHYLAVRTCLGNTMTSYIFFSKICIVVAEGIEPCQYTTNQCFLETKICWYECLTLALRPHALR